MYLLIALWVHVYFRLNLFLYRRRSKNIQTVIIARFLQGSFGSTWATMVSGQNFVRIFNRAQFRAGGRNNSRFVAFNTSMVQTHLLPTADLWTPHESVVILFRVCGWLTSRTTGVGCPWLFFLPLPSEGQASAQSWRAGLK